MERIVICGGCRTGKTTLSNTLAGTVLHIDDLIATHDWSGASEEAARWMLNPGPWVIEGVQGCRALRKAFVLTPNKPCDRVIYLSKPHTALTRAQSTMNKGVETVWREIRAELVRRGVAIEHR